MARRKIFESYIKNETGLRLTYNQVNPISCIYILCNNSDKIAYVGLTGDLAQRIAQHEYSLRKNKHPNHVLQDWVNTNSLNDLSLFVLENVEKNLSKDIMESREQHYCQLMSKLGYNVTNILPSSKERRNKLAPTGLAPHRISCRDLITGDVTIYDSTSEAARATGLSQGAISEASRGHFGHKYRHGGTNVYRCKEWVILN